MQLDINSYWVTFISYAQSEAVQLGTYTSAYATLAKNGLATLQGEVPAAGSCTQLQADDTMMHSYSAFWTASVLPTAVSDLQSFNSHLGSLVIIVLALQEHQTCLQLDQVILTAAKKRQTVLSLLKNMQTTTSRAQLVQDVTAEQTIHPPGFFTNFTKQLDQCG